MDVSSTLPSVDWEDEPCSLIHADGNHRWLVVSQVCLVAPPLLVKLEGPSEPPLVAPLFVASPIAPRHSKALLLLPRGAYTTVLGLVLAVAAARFLVRVLGARGEPL